MIKNTFILKSDYALLHSCIKILQKQGNRDRSITNLFTIFSIITKGLNSNFSFNNNYRLFFKNSNPLDILHRALNNLKPAFYLRNYLKSGRMYMLPVPITDKRASFMAITWLRKTALKHNKSKDRFSFLLAREIFAAIFKKGDSFNLLKDYIHKAIDQRPFKRFIRKKRRFSKMGSRSKFRFTKTKFDRISSLQKTSFKNKINRSQKAVKRADALDYRFLVLKKLSKKKITKYQLSRSKMKKFKQKR